ncbi:MAG: NAD-dependent epimerase/dehydratase family protein [Candidatus Anammoxibacter sp.]
MIAIVSGSTGLIGSETVRFLAGKGFDIVGIENDMRKYFFGEEASTDWNRKLLEESITVYKHYNADIRDENNINKIFNEYGSDIKLIVHTAAQPSHDWAAREPITDFTVNANGTLILLEATRKYCPNATFIFTSTNKVYGNTPNRLPFVELETRWEVKENHHYYEKGIDENMSIDHTKHSLFGSSKVAADIMVQEYGKYFGMNTGIFRAGCLTGSNHSGTEMHGFLSYLMRCVISGKKYRIFGYKGKQVRDNIHSYDLVNMFWHFYQNPKQGEVYNIGGSRHSHCSIQEAIKLCEQVAGKKLDYTYKEGNRIGDHIWYVSDVSKFCSHYSQWKYKYDLNDIITEIYNGWLSRQKDLKK